MADEVTAVVPEELDGERLDRIVAILGDMPRSEAKSRADAGTVTVDGEPAVGKARVSAGVVVAFPPREEAPELEPDEDVEFEVLREDDDVVVVAKPAGVTVHPGAGRPTGTLAAGLLARYPEIAGVGQEGRWGLVHRLDRDTSGALIVARTGEAHESLVDALRRRDIDRRYVALVQGRFDLPRGTIDAPIGRDPVRPRRRALVANGRHAVTHYRVARQWSVVALADVRLETGRTHQIRVHLAGIGHPVVGDPLYGGRDPVRVPRLFLHAASVGFDHPTTGERVTVDAPLPPDLAEVLGGLGPGE